MTLLFRRGRTLGPTAEGEPPGEENLVKARRVVGEFALYMYHLRGLSLPSDSALADIINQGVEKMTAEERGSATLSAAVISAINSAVTHATGQDRPINITSADAARLATDARQRGLDADGEHRLQQAMRLLSGPSGYNDLRVSTGKTDLSQISEANFRNTPYALARLTYATFSALRDEGFSPTNIIHAAHDARTHDLDPNNRRLVRDFAIVDRHDGQRRHQRNDMLQRVRERADADEDLRRLVAERERAKTTEERRRIDAAIQQRRQRILEESGYSAFNGQTRHPDARRAGERLGNNVIDRSIERHRELRTRLGAEAGVELTPEQRAELRADAGVQPRLAVRTTQNERRADVRTAQMQATELDGLLAPATPAAPRQAERKDEQPSQQVAQRTPHRMASPTARA